MEELADPWATDTAPLSRPTGPLPSRLAGLAELDGPRTLDGPDDPWGRKPRPEELSEVAALIGAGWWPLAWNPLHVALPAVWPTGHRGWVHDRLPTVGIIGFGLQRWVEPARWDHDAEQAAYAEQAGLPAPPRRRLWLLRSPFASVGAEVLVRLISRRARESWPDHGGHAAKRPWVMRRAACEVLGWDEAQLWRWWPADVHRDVALAWAEHDSGATGEGVADLVAAGVDPAALTRLTADPPDGAGLRRGQAAAWMRRARSDVEQVLAWRTRGMPADPPEGFGDLLGRASPGEVDTWVGLGFSLYEAFHLLGLPVDEVRALRDAGVAVPEMINEVRRGRSAPG